MMTTRARTGYPRDTRTDLTHAILDLAASIDIIARALVVLRVATWDSTYAHLRSRVDLLTDTCAALHVLAHNLNDAATRVFEARS